jgi:FtsP/CotA-like multicopper oxidase with cupredoxin domain
MQKMHGPATRGESGGGRNGGLTRREVLRTGTRAGAALLLARRAVAEQGRSLVAEIGTPEPDAVPFLEPEVRESKGGLLDTSLHARFAVNEIAGRPIRSRTFEGRLTGPTLKFRPGEVVRVLYVNELPPEPETAHRPGATHGINPTNLHTHGLWVSPAGNSDNVLYELRPGHRFQHEYLIPREHVCGTFWYHPHRHGSVAPQVENGMSGAIIIPGGIDELPEIAVAQERLFVLQQLNDSEVTDRRTHAKTLLEIAGVNEKVTTVNGQHVPTLTMRPGEVQRWRFVAANSHDVLPLSLRPGQLGTGRPPSMHQIAWDGIPLKRVLEKEEVVLAPGNRADVLVRAEDPGLYCVWKRGFPQEKFQQLPDPETIAWVRVEGEPVKMSIPPTLPARYSHPGIDASEITLPERKLVFSIEREPRLRFLINGREFDPDRPDPVVTVDTVEQWRLENSSDAMHPFHIHVNPFQVVESSDPGLDTGVFKDTVAIPPVQDDGRPGYVVIRSRFQRYIGRFVLHCHILGHEDAGMMLLVEIGMG